MIWERAYNGGCGFGAGGVGIEAAIGTAARQRAKARGYWGSPGDKRTEVRRLTKDNIICILTVNHIQHSFGANTLHHHPQVLHHSPLSPFPPSRYGEEKLDVPSFPVAAIVARCP